MRSTNEMNYRLIEHYTINNIKIETEHLNIQIDDYLIIDLVPDKSGHKTSIITKYLLSLSQTANKMMQDLFLHASKNMKGEVDEALLNEIELKSKECAKKRNSVLDWLKYKIDQSLVSINISSTGQNRLIFDIEAKALIKFPQKIMAFITASSSSWRLDDNDIGDLKSFAQSNMSEPPYWSFLREIWEKRHKKEAGNLLMAYAALEIAVKNWYSHLYPQSNWLIFNVPSPPLGKIISSVEGDSSISRENKIYNDFFTKRFVQGITEKRNRLAHSDQMELERENSEEIEIICLTITKIDQIISGINRDMIASFIENCLSNRKTGRAELKVNKH